jgi:bifunctional enzyme CysN/CysC
MLRFLAAGSVDDGKSTLVGRLLYNAQGVYEDQLDSVRKASSAAFHEIDLSLITDGLRAEREQAITIDVAYRYFSTSKRRFIIADTPGHVQYTRNMVTGASTADAAVLLVDARKGILEQTRRHSYLIWLLGIRHLVLAINKIDLVDFDEAVFQSVCQQFREFSSSLPELKTHAIPLSALSGDNVTAPSTKLPWYKGPHLLEVLESLPGAEDHANAPFRFPVQSVVRAHRDFRGCAGQIASGCIKVGQKVTAVRSGHLTTIKQILCYEKELEQAFAPQSVVLCLSDDLDIGRGDMLADPEAPPAVTQNFIADVVWMSEKPLAIHSPYLVKHATQTVCGSVMGVVGRLDIATADRVDAASLALNDIGTIEMQTHRPLFFDPYRANRSTGSFIILDPVDNNTVGAGLISSASQIHCSEDTGKLHVKLPSNLDNGSHRGLTVWLTGLSGSGKTTISSALYTELLARGYRVEVLDGDIIRNLFSNNLGFTTADRDENVRRIGFLAELLSRNGIIVIVSAISPYRATREEVRTRISNFLEVYVNAPLHVCEQRDPKGLYKRARRGGIKHFTGIDDPYEFPLSPDVECRTDEEQIKASCDKVLSAVLEYLSQPACFQFSARHDASTKRDRSA